MVQPWLLAFATDLMGCQSDRKNIDPLIAGPPIGSRQDKKLTQVGVDQVAGQSIEPLGMGVVSNQHDAIPVQFHTERGVIEADLVEQTTHSGR